MLKNYFKIAFRNLLKYRSYSFINVFGLMMGIACFLVISLYIFDELTFDRFHRNADRIYRVVEVRTSETGKQTKLAAVPYQLAEQASGKLPGVVDKARMTIRGRSLVKAKPTDKGFQEENWIISTNFLQVFDFKMIDGDAKTALQEPNTLVVTAETAIKYYGTTNIVGKTLTIGSDSNFYTIKGVLENFPANSHIKFNIVTGENTSIFPRWKDFIGGDWASNAFFTYALLDKNANTERLEQQMQQMLVSNRTRSTTAASKIYIVDAGNE